MLFEITFEHRHPNFVWNIVADSKEEAIEYAEAIFPERTILSVEEVEE